MNIPEIKKLFTMSKECPCGICKQVDKARDEFRHVFETYNRLLEVVNYQHDKISKIENIFKDELK